MGGEGLYGRPHRPHRLGHRHSREAYGGRTGDHKGPHIRSTPPSPLRMLMGFFFASAPPCSTNGYTAASSSNLGNKGAGTGNVTPAGTVAGRQLAVLTLPAKPRYS